MPAGACLPLRAIQSRRRSSFILAAWLSLIFAIIGMLAPRNATVLAGVVASALSVSSAVLLIVEMGTAFDGLIKVSSAPLRYTLAHLGQ